MKLSLLVLLGCLALAMAAANKETAPIANIVYDSMEDGADLPPPTKEELLDVEETAELSPFSKVAHVDDIEGSELDESRANDQDTDTETPDAVELDINEYVPQTSDPKMAKIRENLVQLHAKLAPIHSHFCATSSEACIQRREDNNAIINNVLVARCHIRTCNKRDLKKIEEYKYKDRFCRKKRCHRKRQLKRINKRLYKYYNKLYIRYWINLAKFYKRKIRYVARIFKRLKGRLGYETRRIRKDNDRLKVELAKLQAMHNRKVGANINAHNKIRANMKKAAGKHSDNMKEALAAWKGVRRRVIREKMHVVNLKKLIARLQGQQKAKDAAVAQLKRNIANYEAIKRKLKAQSAQKLKQIGQARVQVRQANAKIKQLLALQQQLRSKISRLNRAIRLANARKAAADKATQRLQAAYNNLKNRLNALNRKHNGAAARQNGVIKGLRAQVAKLNKVCIPDACGICGGDESSCATRRSRLTCYAVGDPHFRTFDGRTYDFQNDGQFVLAKHGQNFEVQNLQRKAWWRTHARLNKGIAVRGGREVAVYYSQWTTNVILVNGRKKALPWRKWVRLGPGFTAIRSSARHVQWRFQDRKAVASVTARRSDPRYLDLYVSAPWQWSSGRSMWGLCGDYDSYVHNDAWWINRWVWRMFRVTGQKRDFFTKPHRRSESELQLATADVDLDAEAKLDKANGVVHVSELKSVTDKAFPTPDIMIEDEETKKTTKRRAPAVPSHFRGVPAPLVRKAKKACRGSHGKARRQCEFDFLQGLPSKAARKTFQEANLEGKQKMLKRCMYISDSAGALFANSRLPRPQKNEGYSVSFWFQAHDSRTSGSILSKGADFNVIKHEGALEVHAGDVVCKEKGVFVSKEWVAITIAISKDGAIKTFIDQNEACKASGGGSLVLSKADLSAGTPPKKGDSHSARGRLAHVYWFSQTVTQKEAKFHQDISPRKCRVNGVRTTEELQNSSEDEHAVADVEEEEEEEAEPREQTVEAMSAEAIRAAPHALDDAVAEQEGAEPTELIQQTADDVLSEEVAAEEAASPNNSEFPVVDLSMSHEEYEAQEAATHDDDEATVPEPADNSEIELD